MRIGTKLGLGLAFHYALIIASLVFVQQLWVLPRVVEQERSTLLDGASSAKAVLQQEQARIGTLAWDWARWDDTYYFAAGQNPEYMERNVSDYWFDEVAIDGVVVRDTENRRVAFESSVDDAVPDEISALIASDKDLILLVSGTPAFVSIYDLYDSQHEGPSTGQLIFYRYLDEAWLNDQLKEYKFNTGVIVDAKDNLPPRVRFVSDNESLVTFSLPLAGNEQLTFRLSSPRDSYREIRAGLNRVLLLVGSLALLGGILTYLLLQKVLSQPLRRLESRFLEQLERLNIRTVGFDDERRNFKSELDWLEAVLDKTSGHWEERERLLNTETQRYREASLEDPLTKIGNRRYLQLSLLRMMSQSPDTAQILMLSFDIDHFKSVNDTYGHDVGDLILKQFTQILVELKRQEDLLARVGGEEFMLAVIIGHDDVKRAAAIAERVRTKVEESVFGAPGEEIRITTSIGYVMAELGAGTDWEALMKLADIALYQAKSSGRNRAIGYRVNDEAGLKGMDAEDLEAAIRAELIDPITC